MDYVRPQIAEGEEKLPKRFKSFKKEVKKLSAGKVRHIRIYPNRQEQPKLRRWMGTACYHVEKESIKREKKDLRVLCLNAKNFNDTKLKWVLETFYDICDEAMNNLLKGYSSNFAANRKKFKMKLRSKKDPQQSITILSKHWGKS